MISQRTIKYYLLIAIKNFNLEIENLPNLLNISQERLSLLLNEDEDVLCDLTEEEANSIFHRSFFLAEGMLSCTPHERMEVIIKTDLMDRYKLSSETLAKYSDVPVEIFNDFLEKTNKIEDKYLVNIYFNLYFLFRILNDK